MPASISHTKSCCLCLSTSTAASVYRRSPRIGSCRRTPTLWLTWKDGHRSRPSATPRLNTLDGRLARCYRRPSPWPRKSAQVPPPIRLTKTPIMVASRLTAPVNSPTTTVTDTRRTPRRTHRPIVISPLTTIRKAQTRTRTAAGRPAGRHAAPAPFQLLNNSPTALPATPTFLTTPPPPPPRNHQSGPRPSAGRHENSDVRANDTKTTRPNRRPRPGARTGGKGSCNQTIAQRTSSDPTGWVTLPRSCTR